ncbi:hypothetical protein FA09DRAFT_330907 [Tilletiopsis washingtonensis]|uniref:thymidylate synthase n=1 Tax=Tilletiopsis washingtonensis TaxID=58919 RepID=A0A316Z9H0_9BASI|nr:hypothetical protein FA09DRAFT_330907 [Tilletiopsis washingtonensis]PWN96823.1 hypothetical protein FA09DRAFT_330907 [Tilletiopsis washingtonensis]
MAPPPMPRVILARHGETAWSLSGQHTGRTELALTARGEAQMRALAPTFVGAGNFLDARRVSHIFVSPRRRSQATLGIMLEHLSADERAQVVPMEVLQECREWDYGAYEGLLTHEIRAKHPGWDIWVDGTPDHPTDADLPGESAEHMTARVDGVIARIRALQQAVIEGHPETTHDDEVVRRGGDIVVVAHGHYNRCFIARWLGLPLTNGRLFEMDAGGVAVLSYAHRSFTEPTLAGMFSSKTGPRPQPVDAPQKVAQVVAQHEELQYLALVRRVIASGETRPDRTGTGTLALFAPQPGLTFSLAGGTLPLLTTKRVFLRGVLEELLWFVAGKTDAKLLSDRNVHIWDGNGSAAFLASRGLGHRREGDLGPVYGFQWRHFGAEYTDADADYTGKGVDQLAEVVRKIKHEPTDRRIILSAWNPKDLPVMALPPCHMFCQFFVAQPATLDARPQLSCQMYQRSCDLGLGVPFNIASYALLTHMIAHVTGCEAHSLTLAMGDAHVYRDHVEPLKVQLERTPRAFPTLRFTRAVDDIDGFTPDDFAVDGYEPHAGIKMSMSV